VQGKTTVADLARLGRVQLSRHFFMREFLYSEIGAIHNLVNFPDDCDAAIENGKVLCRTLLEPIQEKFGPIVIRSAYRSRQINEIGNRLKLGCASNARNAGRHMWDMKDAAGNSGAMACIIVPGFWERHNNPGDWQRMGWWIHDNLDYSEAVFFPKFWAFNIGWHQAPKRVIKSVGPIPRGLLKWPAGASPEQPNPHLWPDM
jgi:hypothetical protein